jgi:hypothetical protein
MQIKLPRKRKKAFLSHAFLCQKNSPNLTKQKNKKNAKIIAEQEYIASTIINEILYEENPCKKNTKYPHIKIVGRKVITMFYW